MRLVLSAFIILFALPVMASDFPSITGRASVIDGDIIDIQGQRIRIWGIDAPESRQFCTDKEGAEYNCGMFTSFALADWLDESQPITCYVYDTDRYRRLVSLCVRNDGQAVGEWLVKNGYALDWPKYSKGDYDKFQKQAMKAKAGIWQGTFELPWEWRHKRKRK